MVVATNRVGISAECLAERVFDILSDPSGKLNILAEVSRVDIREHVRLVRSSCIYHLIHLTLEAFAKVVLYIKKYEFFNYSPLSLNPFPPVGGKGSRCSTVISCPLQGEGCPKDRKEMQESYV
jgi:hypothetical protein